jgi:general secretion pathway protein G
MKMQSLKRAPARAAALARRGFSLAELMVVIVILGLLATLVVPNVIKYLFQANTAVVKSDISQLVQALNSYAVSNGGVFPDSLDVLVEPDENGKTYLQGYTSVPRDPWKNEYVYEPEQGGQDFRVISYGKDGQPGGEGEDSDIDNITMRERK